MPEPARRPSGGVAGNIETLFVIGVILVFGVGGVLRALFGRLPASGIVGSAVAFIGWLIFSSLAAAVAIGVIAFVLSLLGGMPGAGRRGLGRGPWGGGFGGGGWSGGGGGGFSGGGGGFGGGGASGRW